MDDLDKEKNSFDPIDNSKFVEWGKLGGRPRKDNRLTDRITLRFTPEELATLRKRSEEKGFNFVTEYCRLILLEKELPNIEENKILIKYAHNFTRISNYMKMGIFNESEKKRLLDEIEKVINGISNFIKWS